MTTKKTPQTLTPRDEITLPALALYTFMDTNQVQQLAYPNTTNYRTVANRLTQLSATYDEETNSFLDDGYLSYGLVHEKTGAVLGRPKRYFFLTPKNLNHIQVAYQRRGKLQLFQQHFADANLIRSNGGFGYARSHILHELKITDYGLAFNHPTENATPLFWERTSPKSEGITRAYNVNKFDPKTNTNRPQTVRFNPDGVDASFDPTEQSDRTTVYLSVVEIDRDTESRTEVLQKIYGFDELIRQKHLPELRDHFLQRYGLTRKYPLLSDPENYRINFRVRFITTNTRRRNEIIHLIAHRSNNAGVYHVATFDDIEKWDLFYTSPHWYAASDYEAIKQREDRETRGMRVSALNDWLDEQVANHMSPVPYFYTTRRSQE